jgi:Ca-activated chloride channel family protein
MRNDRDRLAMLAWVLVALGLATGALIHMLRSFEAQHPHLLWALGLVVLLGAWYVIGSRTRHPQVRLSTLGAIAHGPTDVLALLRPLPMALSLLGAALLLMAMARPQSRDNWQDVHREGIDIVMALDISVSMLAKDLRPDRLEASKRVAMEFIDARPNDRIGLVVYEGEAFTQCPLTTDHAVLKDFFQLARPGQVTGGTAVGMGLATALNRLRDSEAKSKVVILLTDGVNNAGSIQPIDAAQIAATLGIRVYTIGVGTHGKALSPVTRYANGQFRYEYVDVEIDERMLRQVADLTGGKYFRATDEKKLKAIYHLEKTRINVTEHSRRNEEYFPFVLVGAGALLLAFILDRTLLRTMA